MRRLIFVIVLFIEFSGAGLKGQYRHTYLRLGEIELWHKNYLEAINYFTYFIEDHQGMYDGYYLRGLAKYNLDDLLGAEYDFTKAIACLPEYPRLYLVRGVVRAESYKIPQALVDFNKAIVLDSNYTDAYYYRLVTYYSLKKFDVALKDCNTIIELDSAYNSIYILRGALYMEKEMFEEAVSDFNRSIANNPLDGRAYVERGKALGKLKKYDLALQDLDSALAIDSTNSYAYFQRSLIYMDQLHFEEAMEDLNKVIEISPDNELAYFNRALIKNNENKEEEALDDLIHILDQNPDNVLVYYNLGISLAKIGDYVGAIESFNSVLNLFPDYTDAYYQRALIKKTLGDADGANTDMMLYEALLEKNKHKNDTIKNKESLALLKLSHLESSFLKEKDKENRLQFKDINVKLKPIYQLEVDTSLVNSNTIQENSFKSISFYTDYNVIEKKWFSRKMNALDSLLKLDPLSSDLYLNRGLLYHRGNAFEQALEDFNKALSLNPENIIIYMCRGNTRLAQLHSYTAGNTLGKLFTENNKGIILKTYSDAVFDFQKALKYKPNFLYARYNLGHTKFLIEKYEEALTEFRVVSKERKLANSSFNAGLLLLFLGLEEDACVELGLAGEQGVSEAYPVIRKYCK